MKRFWTYQIRYRLARWIIHFGLFVWPPGPAKAEVLDLLYAWRAHVDETLLAPVNADHLGGAT